MTTVTFRNGTTVSDDSNASTTLRNGGHRTRFIPALVGAVEVAAEAKDWANKANIVVFDSEYSAKEYAVGATGGGLGSAKAWAIGGTLPGGALSAKQHADAAAASAASALNAPGTSATSNTNAVILGTGLHNFVTQTGKLFTPGQFIVVASTASPANYMVAQVTQYNSGTGAIQFSISSSGGSGTFNDWTISLTALANVAGAATLGANNIYSGTNAFNNDVGIYGSIGMVGSSVTRTRPSGNSSIVIENQSSTAGNFAQLNLTTGSRGWAIGTEGGSGRLYIYDGTKDVLVTSGTSVLIYKPARNDDTTDPEGLPRLSQVKNLINQPTLTTVGALNIDLSLGTFFAKTITGASTITVSNVAAAGVVNNFVLELINPGTNVTFGFAPKWQGGIAPTLTTTGRDVLFFYSHDGGSIWTGVVVARDVR